MGAAAVDESGDWASQSQLWKTNDQMADKEGERSTVFWVGGKQYKGEWSRNKMNGKGTLTYSNGDKYEGEWVDNKRHGFGTYWVCEGGKFRVSYNGTWVAGRKQGFGVFYNAKGERYEGEWKDSARHGKGRQTFGGRVDGRGADVYEGDWAADKRCGEGTMQYANGDVFQGCWDADDKHGEGTYYYEEKAARYDGVWERGTARCGEYQAVDPGAVPRVQLPCLELLGPDEVMARARKLALRHT
eukprot:CAMPEP_0197599116 /NCGR_PEP_ID=MMETSP1326-20131121/30707_1 /TAXON_ID=1155430 /ORGANISM="Genus nov. species nov., Strain RCC2288" /LENGTH=242 /DNA_ID=CAMNT_0043166029 /DNA_START=179 /DNA_END=907 /DNA_ORIENTATION=+